MTRGEEHKKNFYCFHWGIGEDIMSDRKEREKEKYVYYTCFFPYRGWYILQTIISIAKGIWVCMTDRGKQRLHKLHCTEEKRFFSHFWSPIFDIWNVTCMQFAPTSVRSSKVSPDKSLVAKVRALNFQPFALHLFAPICKASKGHFLKTYFFLWKPLSEWNFPGSSKSKDNVYQYIALLI